MKRVYILGIFDGVINILNLIISRMLENSSIKFPQINSLMIKITEITFSLVFL